ncbi:hypothetical protein M0Q97_08850 [Candidatus Dojkabacteria bacterium]|jgi:hypothetical protein|nr:hypothetical protein [Candidatus Dojkabacteria bacterium]
MSEIKPITPEEARNEAKSTIPEFVIIGINNAIKNNYIKSGFTIKQKDIMVEIMKVAPFDCSSEEIYKNHWMDFEDLYRNVGWKVSYDKPGYNEDEAIFEFKTPNK